MLLMAKTCSNCSLPLDDDAAFCASCATPVVQIISCPKCDKTINADAKFCKYCAFDLSKPVQNPPTTTSPPPVNQNPPISNLPPQVEPITLFQDISPEVQSETTDDNPASLISPSGAAFAVICFFLPWLEISFCNTNRVLTGAEAASLAWTFWFIPIMGVIAFTAYFICKIKKILFRARPFIIGSSIIALGILVYYSRWGIGEFFSGNFQVLNALRFGSYGTVTGFILAIVGCIFISRSIVKGELYDTGNENKTH
jgi:hypothetical protein